MLQARRVGSLSCLISMPGHPQPRGSWPVLVFLHGNGEAAPLDIRDAMTRHGPLNGNAAGEAKDRFILVAPQLPAPGGKVWGSHGGTIREILGLMVREYRGDEMRCYLTGFSYGGDGVLSLAPSQRDLWAALWAVDPTDPPPADPGIAVGISAGEYARRNQRAFQSVLGTRERGAETGAQRWYQDAGLTHVPTAVQAYGNSALYSWLLRQARRNQLQARR